MRVVYGTPYEIAVHIASHIAHLGRKGRLELARLVGACGAEGLQPAPSPLLVPFEAGAVRCQDVEPPGALENPFVHSSSFIRHASAMPSDTHETADEQTDGSIKKGGHVR